MSHRFPDRPSSGDPFFEDPSWDDAPEVRRVQPYEAVKAYRCPGCDHEIRVGEGHVVVVPPRAPDERRHWHHSCWDRDLRRSRPR